MNDLPAKTTGQGFAPMEHLVELFPKMTEQDLERARRIEKKNIADFAIARKLGPLLLMLVLALYLSDRIGTQIYGGDAVILTKSDYLSRGHHCKTKLQTNFGPITLNDDGVCSERAWKAGQHVKIAVWIGRLTRSVNIMRDYGVLALPHHDTLGGLDSFPQRDYVANPPAAGGAMTLRR